MYWEYRNVFDIVQFIEHTQELYGRQNAWIDLWTWIASCHAGKTRLHDDSYKPGRIRR